MTVAAWAEDWGCCRGWVVASGEGAGLRSWVCRSKKKAEARVTVRESEIEMCGSGEVVVVR